MSALLQALRSETGAKFCWSGRIDFRIPPPASCEPVVLAWNDHASIVFAAGVLKERDAVGLAQLVLTEARRPENRIVYVALACQGGRLGSLRSAAEALTEARRNAGVVAILVEAAFGPALWLAYQCDLVFSQPTTSLGWLECFSAEGEFDSAATMGMVEDLAAMNSRVAPSQWARLVQSSMTGEQAEAIGVVGGLKRDVFALSGIDPNGSARLTR